MTSTDALIPIRWCAPEVILSMKYSSASDVWSFFMLMTEVWSRSQLPFRDLTGMRVQQMLVSVGSYHTNIMSSLPCPPSANQDFFKELAFNCLQVEPDDRATFVELRDWSATLDPLSSTIPNVTKQQATEDTEPVTAEKGIAEKSDDCVDWPWQDPATSGMGADPTDDGGLDSLVAALEAKASITDGRLSSEDPARKNSDGYAPLDDTVTVDRAAMACAHSISESAQAVHVREHEQSQIAKKKKKAAVGLPITSEPKIEPKTTEGGGNTDVADGTNSCAGPRLNQGFADLTPRAGRVTEPRQTGDASSTAVINEGGDVLTHRSAASSNGYVSAFDMKPADASPNAYVPAFDMQPADVIKNTDVAAQDVLADAVLAQQSTSSYDQAKHAGAALLAGGTAARVPSVSTTSSSRAQNLDYGNISTGQNVESGNTWEKMKQSNFQSGQDAFSSREHSSNRIDSQLPRMHSNDSMLSTSPQDNMEPPSMEGYDRALSITKGTQRLSSDLVEFPTLSAPPRSLSMDTIASTVAGVSCLFFFCNRGVLDIGTHTCQVGVLARVAFVVSAHNAVPRA